MLKKKHNFSFIYPELIPPKGDSFLDQCKRIGSFMENLNLSKRKSIVIITHSGTIRAFLSYILHIDPNIALSIEISHLSITSLEVMTNGQLENSGGKYRLLNVNHTVI